MNGLTVYNAELSNLIEGEILEDGYLYNVVKVADLNETLKSVRDEIDGYKSALGDLRAEAKQYDIDCAGKVKLRVEVKDGQLTVLCAMNGYGDAMDLSYFSIDPNAITEALKNAESK